MNLSNLSGTKDVITRAFGRAMLMASMHSPEIFLGLGIGSGVLATVLACKATLKIDQVKCETQNTFMRITAEKASIPESKYSEADFKRDMTITYFQGAFAIARLYLPAIMAGVASVGFLTQSYRILNKRNATILAAYEGLQLTFKQYRDKIAKDFDVDPIQILEEEVGEATVTETETDAQGNEQTTVKRKKLVNRKALSDYAVVFGEMNPQWQHSHLHNELRLKNEEAYLNEMLRIRGQVFLNEAYDRLGFPRTQAGCFVGWVYDEEKGADNFIDIGWNHPRNEPDLLKDPNPPFILDFNVDGEIWKILS